MKLRFVGEDGSMGLRNGEVYETRIFIKGRFLWVEWKVNLFSVKSCPYSSTKAFAQNSLCSVIIEKPQPVTQNILPNHLDSLLRHTDPPCSNCICQIPVLDYEEAVSHSKSPVSLQPESFVGLTLKQAKMKLGIKN